MPANPPSIEERILSALRVAARRGEGPLTVARLHTRPGLTRRRWPEILAACQGLREAGRVEHELVPSRRRRGELDHAFRVVEVITRISYPETNRPIEGG